MIRPGFPGSENVSTARIWLAKRATPAMVVGVEVKSLDVAPSTTVVRIAGCDLFAPPIRRVIVS